jgi:hypothetical protein
MMTISIAMRNKVAVFVSVLALAGGLAWGGAAAQAQPAEQAYAVLIVGDEGDAEMLRLEKVLINEMAKQIRSEASAEKLPIYSYHFNKERERAYCENKLNVLAEDLLFVGVVTLENKVPTKVVYRIDRIMNSPRAAKDVLDRAEELAEGPAVSRAIPVAPAQPPSTSPTQPPASPPSPPSNPPGQPASGSSSPVRTAEEGFRVQLGSFTQRVYADDRKADADKAGLTVLVVESSGADGDKLYKVLSPVFKERATADAQLARFKEAGFDQAFLVRGK